jgi:putative transposase
MNSPRPAYHGYRFPPEIISHAVWLYHRFSLSFRDVEDLLAERGITVTYEAIRQWCLKFGPRYARRLKRGQGRLGDTWHLDEPFVSIRGRRHYLWRAVDQDGDVIDIFLQPRREQRAAKRFFHKLLRGQGAAGRQTLLP